MATFKKWKETNYPLKTGLNIMNLDTGTNIVKVLNPSMNGSTIYMSTRDNVSPSYYEERIERGSSASLVRTRDLGTIYLYNPDASEINIVMIEIETDDISFIFNASNQVQISGVLTSDSLKAVELKLDADRTLFVVDSAALTKLDSLITLQTAANDKLDQLIAKP